MKVCRKCWIFSWKWQVNDMSFAIFGGSFNPLHLGHLYIADEVRRTLNYTTILFIPSNISAHKRTQGNATGENRLAMLRCVSEKTRWMEVDDREIKRGGVSFSIDTIEELYGRYSLKTKPGFIIGDDLVHDLDKWKNVRKLMKLVDLIVVRRKKRSIYVPFPHKEVKTLQLDISSSDIRKRIEEKRTFQYLLPDMVYNYIQQEGLYQA